MEFLWEETKRHCGLPLSFTKYLLDEKRLFCRSGVLTRKEEQISLYHIRDYVVTVSLVQRIFGVGTVRVISSDRSTPQLLLENVKHPYEVRDTIYNAVEADAEKRGLRRTEYLGGYDVNDDDDDDDDWESN